MPRFFGGRSGKSTVLTPRAVKKCQENQPDLTLMDRFYGYYRISNAAISLRKLALSRADMQGRNRLRKIGRIGHHLAIAQHDRPSRMPGHVLIMRHEDNRQPLLFVELPEQVNDLAAGATIEI